MAAKLVAEEGILKELVLSFEEGDHWVIGRDPDTSQLLVEDPSASRKHALGRKTPEGIVIENLSATNPVLVNDEEVIQPRLLLNEDTVKIGDTIFRFYSDPEAHVVDESTPSLAEELLPPAESEAKTSDVPPQKGAEEDKPQEEEHEEERHDTIFDEDDGQSGLAKVHFDLIETGRWLLKVIGGPNNGAEFSMQAGNNYLIGTDPNTCDIVLHDNSVSRQHARIAVAPDDTLTLEDLKSRNGTRIDGEAIEGKHPLLPQTFVTMGTTSFVVYDREGEMQTIISPLLPSIVKVLQNEEIHKKEVSPAVEAPPKEEPTVPVPPVAPPPKAKSSHALGAFIAIGVIIGLFSLIGIGLSSLFNQESVVIEKTYDTDKLLTEALKPFPEVKFSYNKSTGRLLLVGHVLTATDKSQMVYNLQGLHFIKDIDDSGVIIDEFVWSEANQVLSKNPNWKGVTVHSPAPGRFVLSGYLQSRDQAAQVWDYITRNFSFLDLLENRIVVEEDLSNAVTNALRSKGFYTVKVEVSNGEVSLTGYVPVGKVEELQQLAAKFQDLPGVRAVKNYVTEAARDEAVVNISDKYTVTGTSKADGGNLTAIINGRILSKGDILDGMKITEILPNVIFLEKDDIRYRIDFGR